MPENIFENSNSSEEGKDYENDDPADKADIHKCHGHEGSSVEGQVSNKTQKHPADHDFNGNDVIDENKIIRLTLPDNNQETIEKEQEKDKNWEEEGQDMTGYEPNSKKFKQFGEGNFFMYAD